MITHRFIQHYHHYGDVNIEIFRGKSDENNSYDSKSSLI